MDVDNIISDDVKETRKARASRGIFNPRISRATQSSPVCNILALITLSLNVILNPLTSKFYRDTMTPLQKKKIQIPNEFI